MSQAYGGRMYHPGPHHNHHGPQHHPPPPPPAPPYRQSPGEQPPHHQGFTTHHQQQQQHQHQHHRGSATGYHYPRSGPSVSYGNSVSVYSVPKQPRPQFNGYNSRRGRGGPSVGRGSYHNVHPHKGHLPPANYPPKGHPQLSPQSSYRHPSSQPPDFDLEWDHYDFDAKSSRDAQRGGRRRNQPPNSGGRPALNDVELEWDDYDLRPKDEVEDHPAEPLDYILTEGVFPLIGVVAKTSLSRGHIPLGAIQVCRFPRPGESPNNRRSTNNKSLHLNKDLLVLTSELRDGALLSSLEAFPPPTPTPSPSPPGDLPLALTRDRESSVSSPTDSPSKDSGESEAASNGSFDEDLLNETYESAYRDRLGDIDLYALAPHDFDSPDSTFSRSLADLTDISLYAELGIDPSLVRAGLERTRSLGDATRAQDACTDKTKADKAKKRKRKGSEKVDDTGTLLGRGDEGTEEKKTKRLAPNYFVAAQVSNPEIHESLKDVQQTVVSGDEKLKDAMVPIGTLHLTIMVMHLATEKDVDRAKEALAECHRLLHPRFQEERLSIVFGGLGHFNNQVMFAKIKDQEGILETLYEIADTVEKCFSDYNLVSTGERGFKPHLTVMKLSRAPSLRKKGVRRIKSELYKAHSGEVFGTQVLDGLQLCSINKPKTADGYYHKAAEVLFGEAAAGLERDMQTIAEGEEPVGDPTATGSSMESREMSVEDDESRKHGQPRLPEPRELQDGGSATAGGARLPEAGELQDGGSPTAGGPRLPEPRKLQDGGSPTAGGPRLPEPRELQDGGSHEYGGPRPLEPRELQDGRSPTLGGPRLPEPRELQDGGSPTPGGPRLPEPVELQDGGSPKPNATVLLHHGQGHTTLSTVANNNDCPSMDGGQGSPSHKVESEYKTNNTVRGTRLRDGSSDEETVNPTAGYSSSREQRQHDVDNGNVRHGVTANNNPLNKVSVSRVPLIET